MKINFNGIINTNFNKAQRINSQPSFGSAKTRKFLEELRNAQNFKHINATFDDMVDAYNDLGYDVILKRGSHASVPLTDKINITLVIPHGKKYVATKDIKRLYLILNGEIEKALAIH